MFIEEVVTKIWEPVSKQYESVYNEAMAMDQKDLYNVIINEIKKVNTQVYKSRALNMTVLPTSGCPHNNRKGKFSGCSMCDFNSTQVDNMAKMAALKQKSPELYGKSIKFSFENSRGIAPRPGIVELITAQDCFNEEELPDNVFEDLFINKGLFQRKPYKVILETRISSISSKKLSLCKEKLGKKVAVEFGLEVGDEWIRNHWINKNVTNSQVEEAIRTIRETGCESSANILIGIPGLTETQSIDLFVKTFLWLKELGCTHILCSPLSRKERTLQGFIYEHLRDNQRLNELNLVHGEQTGMPFIFTVFDALSRVLQEVEGAQELIALSPTNFSPYFEMTENLTSSTEMEGTALIIIDALKNYTTSGDPDILRKTKQVLENNRHYHNYLVIIEKQKKAGDVANTISILGEEISKVLWSDRWEEYRAMLESEFPVDGQLIKTICSEPQKN